MTKMERKKFRIIEGKLIDFEARLGPHDEPVVQWFLDHPDYAHDYKPRRNRGRGHPGGPTAFTSRLAARLFREKVRQLKQDGCKYRFRDEATQQVKKDLKAAGINLSDKQIRSAAKNYRK
jgi:hypothetical protein